MSAEAVPLSALTVGQTRRVRALQVACVLLPIAHWADKVRVARWIETGEWPT